MRRALLALAAAGALVTAAAGCGGVAGPASGGPAAASLDPTTQASLADTRAVCDALSQVYGKNLGPFASALTNMIAARTASGGTAAQSSTQQAQQALRGFADGVRGATQASTNPQVRADGEHAAAGLRAKSGDARFFSTIKTSDDVNTLLGPTLKQWLAPVNQHCS
jgi:hypothetical protein